MREIKFRAWNKRIKEMYVVTGCHFDEGIFYCESKDGTRHTFGLIDLEILQYTGLKDNNGVEIYEGDVLRQEKNCMFADGRHNKKVVFLFDQFLSGSCSLYLAVVSFDAEVIGNIHENPELIEAAK